MSIPAIGDLAMLASRRAVLRLRRMTGSCAALHIGGASALLMISGCGSDDYPRNTPQEMVDSAGQMLKNGDADRLAELVYTGDPRSSALKREVGRVLGSLDALSRSINENYADDIVELREAVANGEAEAIGLGPLVASAIEAGQSGSRGGVGFGPLGAGANQTPTDLVAQVLADPFSWLDRATDQETTKLGTVEIDDGLVALTWDDEAILPPVGIVLERIGEQWYWDPPLELLPGVVRPDTDDEYSIWASLLRVIDNLLIDLQAEVESGKHRTLDDLANAAGEKVFIPAVLVFYAYSRAVQQDEQGSGG